MAKKGLGKGLDALMKSAGDVSDFLSSGFQVEELKLTEIEPNSAQPRSDFDREKLEALADSIREYGVLQPIVVRKLENGFYQIIAGERRWRAARLAGVKTIPSVVKELEQQETMEIALIENLQRENLNPVEEALGYKELMDGFGLTQEQLSQKVGKSRSAVANSIRLLNLPEEIKEKLIDGSLTAGHARALLQTDNKGIQLMAAERIIEDQLNVRQAEQYIAALLKPKAPNRRKPENIEMARYFLMLEEKLSTKLGTKVKIKHLKNKGKIEIPYASNEDFERIMELIGRHL